LILSTSLDVSETEVIGLDPFGFAQRIIEEGLDKDNELVKTNGVASGKLSLLAGWAPRRWLGLNGYIALSRGKFTEFATETKAGGGLAAGIDFKNFGIVPIGVQLVARTSAITSASADLASRSWTYGLGVFYTGWEDFSIGVETAMNTFERRGGGDDFESFVATINLKYWP
jgi:hypothetical protein